MLNWAKRSAANPKFAQARELRNRDTSGGKHARTDIAERGQAAAQARGAGDRSRGTACHSAQSTYRIDIGIRAGLRAGQSRDPTASFGERFSAVLSAQSEAVPSDRRFGSR